MAPKPGTYGAIDVGRASPADAGLANVNEQMLERREWSWERRGHAWLLLLDVVALLGRQQMVLTFMVFTVTHSHEYMMSCDERKVGLPMAFLCEYTKAYVRCFPLLAAVVSLMIASRIYLYLRLYYQMLKRGVLVEFDKFEAYMDPMFIILLVMFAHACLHFVLNLGTSYSLSANLRSSAQKIQAEEFQAQVTDFAVQYLGPAVLFLLMLRFSYDLAEQSLPFSKYFDDDPERAIKAVGELQVVCESAAMVAVQKEFDTAISTGDEAFKIVMERALKWSGQRGEGLSKWRMVATWWPARVLLDPRLRDPESSQFRLAWYVLAIPSLMVVLLAVYSACLITWRKLDDVMAGHVSDMAGLAVCAVCVFLIMRFSYEFTWKALARPFWKSFC